LRDHENRDIPDHRIRLDLLKDLPAVHQFHHDVRAIRSGTDVPDTAGTSSPPWLATVLNPLHFMSSTRPSTIEGFSGFGFFSRHLYLDLLEPVFLELDVHLHAFDGAGDLIADADFCVIEIIGGLKDLHKAAVDIDALT